MRDILGLRSGVPNNADVDSETSKAIAAEMLRILHVTRTTTPKEAAGTALEIGVVEYLATELSRLVPDRRWAIDHRKLITDFVQYRHLARLDDVIEAEPTLRVEIGRDYLVRPDVTVGIMVEEEGAPVLHAAVSCKWTIRSDRVQNIRHEGVILTRHRRGRQPHIVTVTAEPLPTRLASIARGTGEVDAVYHVALEELLEATERNGTVEQRAVLRELVGQDRLFDLIRLPKILSW